MENIFNNKYFNLLMGQIFLIAGIIGFIAYFLYYNNCVAVPIAAAACFGISIPFNIAAIKKFKKEN